MERVNILGVGVSAVNMSIALQTIHEWIERREPHYVCVTGVHGLIESQHDDALYKIHNAAGMVTPDGMPLVWISRLQGYRQVARVYGPDLMLAVCAQNTSKYRHYFYGGGEGVAEQLKERLIQKFPLMNIVGTYCPPFRTILPEEDAKIIEQINQTKPDIVWVGLSTPKQERWMAAHVGQIKGATLIGVGAAFDFLSGTKKQAPRWIQRSGFEWLFRLLSEPRRLGRRYLVNNPLFILLIAAQLLGIKNREINGV